MGYDHCISGILLGLPQNHHSSCYTIHFWRVDHFDPAMDHFTRSVFVGVHAPVVFPLFADADSFDLSHGHNLGRTPLLKTVVIFACSTVIWHDVSRVAPPSIKPAMLSEWSCEPGFVDLVL